MVARTGTPPCRANVSAIRNLQHLSGGEPRGVPVARVPEVARDRFARPPLDRPRWRHRAHDEHLVELDGLSALVLGDQDLVELLTGPDPDLLDPAAGRDRLDQVLDLHAGDLGHEDLAPAHRGRAADGELDPLLKPD